MISKETFVKTMESLHELDKKMSAVDDVMKDINRDFCGFFIPQALDIPIELLEEAMKDDNGWICYFAFECYWLEDFHDDGIIVDGESVNIENWEDVYDLIMRMNHE